jgi:hypothetical protein
VVRLAGQHLAVEDLGVAQAAGPVVGQRLAERSAGQRGVDGAGGAVHVPAAPGAVEVAALLTVHDDAPR